jgi:UDP-N-acetylglucosamine 2-epimerase (non-hydrolysing)
MVGFDIPRVREGLRILGDQAKAGLRVVRDYEAPKVSEKIVRIIQSYVNYVNRTVWRKPQSQKQVH